TEPGPTAKKKSPAVRGSFHICSICLRARWPAVSPGCPRPEAQTQPEAACRPRAARSSDRRSAPPPYRSPANLHRKDSRQSRESRRERSRQALSDSLAFPFPRTLKRNRFNRERFRAPRQVAEAAGFAAPGAVGREEWYSHPGSNGGPRSEEHTSEL